MSSIEKVQNITFENFLSTYKRFFVPAFQRPYSWQARHISTFWDGIISADPHYYVGTLVAIPSKKDSGLEIIDGQQRLTTLMLFFVALRDYLNKIDLGKKNELENLKNKINGITKYLWAQDEFSGKKDIRLKFNKRNLVSVFEALVEEDDSVLEGELDDNQGKLLKNYSLVKKQVKDYFQKSSDKEKAFKELTEKLKEIEFIVIICKSDSDAFQLFEGLNSTGLDLSVVDLLKNAVLKVIDEKSRHDNRLLSEAERIWNDMETRFEEQDIKLFARFVRHQWIAERGYISNSKLFDEIKNKELSSGKSAKEILKYEKALLKDAKTYLDIRFASKNILNNKKLKGSKDGRKILEYFDLFTCLNVEQAYEVLLSLFNKSQKNEAYTPRQLMHDIQRLWHFAFKVRFLSISPASYESIFADFCYKITNYIGNDINTKSQLFFNELSALVDSKEQEQEFVKNFASDLKYGNKDRKLIHYILKKIYLISNPTIEVSEPSIDHFIPKEPSNWGMTEEDVQGFINNIGNLALLNTKINQQLQNAALDEKIKKVYETNEFDENRLVLVGMKEQFRKDPEIAIKERGIELGAKIFQDFSVKK